jgi:excisionase family DNA binding protein
LTVKEVATALSVSTAHIYKLTKRGFLPHVRVLNAIRVRPADLEDFIASRARGAVKPVAAVGGRKRRKRRSDGE